ncbi:hypothetical protein PENTCL1PPCAC_27182 [Pristionchus entomophagus]|uniref:Nucleolar 27S pre-rRNA processing Urb2/Npa2 C-terminal domain-containing protein n=1 Tax=Pristionchus entomophagus TaxID=358040 RepID=A0AAV5UF39_9BILA|nr:hypothetical protein PENTCL1PPCAC_27182 [Pristionchus entomophagus]
MVALDNSINNENHLVEEIRKALGGAPEKLIGTLSSLHAWADEVLMAVIDCVEKPQSGGEKKKKGAKGTITLNHLLNDVFKKFLTEHVAQLGAEGAVKMVKELETRIEDEKREEERTRIYSHLLAHFVSQGANVMGYEKLRGTVKETLAKTTVGLWRRGVNDASSTLARVLVYILIAERDYIEGREKKEGEEWWMKEVMDKEKKLKKTALFATLTTLLESENEKKEWSKVDLDSAEKGTIGGVEGVLSARWILVDTVVCHAPSLAARCSPTVYEQLMRIVVRAHVERAELASLMTRLSSMADLPKDTWGIVMREGINSIHSVFEKCSENRERLMVEGEGVTIGEEGRGDKHRVGCGCAAPVSLIIRGLAIAPKTSFDEKTLTFIEKSLILSLSSMDTTVDEPLREGVHLMKWLIEERAKYPCKREWPTEGVQLLRGIKAMLTKERTGEMHNALISLSRCILLHYGHSTDYPSRLFLDVGHVATRVLIGESNINELTAMKPSGAVKQTDKLAKSLLKWANSVKREEERDEKEVELLIEWSQSLLTTTSSHGLSTVVLQTMVSMGRERREELLPQVWSEKETVKKMIDDCLSLLLTSATPDETFERNTDEHSTSIISSGSSPVDGRLARSICLFLLNCTPYLATKISPADLATWERLRAMDAHCASLVLERTKPEAIQSLFSSLPSLIDSFTPAITAFQPEQASTTEEVEEEKEEEGDGDKKKTGKKRKRVEGGVDPLKTASLQQLTAVSRLAAVALSDRAAVPSEDATAALAAAASCLAVAAPGGVRAAAEAAAAAFYEMATRCLEVYGESAAHSGMLAVALAAAATRQPPSNDYERSRCELLQHARLLAAAARHCKQGLLKDQVSIYSQLLARVLQSAAAHGERIRGMKEESDGPTTTKRRRDEQRTMHAVAKAANAINDETHFAKVMPFVISDCLLPLRTAPPSIQYPAVLLSHAIDRYGRSFLATCLPPAQRLAYTRMFPTFKEMNRKIV